MVDTGVAEALRQVRRLATRRTWPRAVKAALDVDPRLPVERLSTGGYVVDSLRCAVWAVQQTTSPEAILIALVNRGHDADTTGAIAGGLLGVLYGVDAWPSRWLERLEASRELVHVAARLAGKRSELDRVGA
jgi:ADP-ribosylglycohydrolase